MTRKDYQIIAAALMSSTPLASDGPLARRIWAQTVAAVSRALYHDDCERGYVRLFDEGRFYDACMGRAN